MRLWTSTVRVPHSVTADPGRRQQATGSNGVVQALLAGFNFNFKFPVPFKLCVSPSPKLPVGG